jgi:hypothetical protein
MKRAMMIALVSLSACLALTRPAAKASMLGLEVAFDRLADDNRGNLMPSREQLFNHLNPLLIARHSSVESSDLRQFGKMTPQPSEIVLGLACIETLQCKHLLAASHASCVISPLHKISNLLRGRKLHVHDSHSAPLKDAILKRAW